jgi:hypothetical protein
MSKTTIGNGAQAKLTRIWLDGILCLEVNHVQLEEEAVKNT